jgi:D-inositol-3-phosphate glycosyltransferase
MRAHGGRIATLMLHTSPLEQPGQGDAGGMNIYVVESAIQIARLGVEVDIFTRRNHASESAPVEIAPGVRVRFLDAGPAAPLTKEDLPTQLPAMQHSMNQLLHQLDKDYYQLIHSHYWISGQLGWMISEQSGLPLVHTMHTMAKVKNQSLAADEPAEPATREYGEEQVVRFADALIANTDAEAAALVSLYDAEPGKVQVVAPGVDLERFAPGRGKAAARAELYIPGDALVLTFVGRLQPHKGPEVLVRATADILRRHPELREKLIVIIMGGASGNGVGEPAKLRDIASELGITDVLRFIPPVSREELPNWYRAADLICVPSYSESFGLVALEAQSCGTPVVATAVGGLRTAVADGVSGALVDGHDPRAWSAVICRLLMNPNTRLNLSVGALTHARNFGWDLTARRTLDIYDQILSAR